MAGRAAHRILLIIVIVFCFFSSGYAGKVQEREEIKGQFVHGALLMKEVSFDSLQVGVHGDETNTLFQDVAESRFRELAGMLSPDFSLEISFNNRNLKELFLVNNSILSDKGFGDQFLYTIDITPSVMFLDRYSLEFTYSAVPKQRNFPNSTVLSFENERVILNEVNRFSGHAFGIAAAFSQPITESIRASFHSGVTRIRLNVEETLQYHPADPFVRNFTIVTLPFRKREVTYSNPFIGLSVEFQLLNIRLRGGYQIHLYEFEEVSSSNFYISLGVRLRDLF